MGFVRGLDCKLYNNSATYETPTWVELTCAKDVNIGLEFQEADASSRGSGGWEQTVATLASLEVTGSAIKNKDDAAFVAFDVAAKARTTLDLLVMDGVRTSADSDGWRFDGEIRSWSESQGLQDVVQFDFTIKPVFSDNVPTAVAGPQPPA